MKTAFRYLVAFFLRGFSMIVPKTNIWVFTAGRGDSFTGNSKYFFLYCNRYYDDIRPIWISRDETIVRMLRSEGYQVLSADSFLAKYCLLRAKVKYISHSNQFWAYSGGCETIQLWHGNALKKMGFDKDTKWPFLVRLHRRIVSYNWEYFCVTSRNDPVQTFCSAYRQRPEQMLVSGYPRNDILFDKIEGFHIGIENDLYERIRSLANEATIVAYLPTWRRAFGEQTGEPITDTRLDLPTLNRLLVKNDAYLLVKFHPQDEVDLSTNMYDRIIELPTDFDVYPALKHVDILITDYSSIFFDFLLLDRPILFYAFDRETYMKSRGFYFDYETITPGPIAESTTELHQWLEHFFNGDDGFESKRSDIRDRFYENTDGNSSERLVQLVNGILD